MAEDAIKSEDEILFTLTNEIIVPKIKTKPSLDYENITFLGEGSFSKVYKVKNKFTGELRAMKQLKKTKPGVYDDEDIINEINILKKMDHPNIMKIFEFYNTDNSYSVINELCSGGELFDEIINKGPFPEDEAAYVLYQIMHAVNYFHKMKIIHRDLKPENILITGYEDNGYPFVKICDFGTAKLFEKGKIERTLCGSSYYVAPEVLNQNYNEKCDIWSCGVILYIMLCKCPPFPGKNDREIMKNVIQGKYDIKCSPFDKCSKECISMIKDLLTYNPNSRMSAAKALEHPFFNKYKSKEKFNEISDTKMVNKFINNLKTYKKVSIIQETALAYLVHNFSQREDIVNAGRLFNQFDLQTDGKITKEELTKALKARLPKDKDIKKHIDSIFNNLDADNNGFIEYEEFIRAAIDKETLLDEGILRFAFRYFDKDNSGIIEFQEVKEMFEKNLSGEKGVEEALKKIVSEVDVNSDGKISFEEFEIIMKKMIH